MRDDRDDPFDEFFREIERMMSSMASGEPGLDGGSGFGADAHFNVYRDDGTVRVVGDLPGIEKDDLGVKCDGERLTVTATTTHSEFEERIDLPVRVDEHSASATFNNGVLEVTLRRDPSATSIDLD